jgi:hypothetical protein
MHPFVFFCSGWKCGHGTPQSGCEPVAKIGRLIQTLCVFDFLFPIGLFLGPLALAVLLRTEARRNTQGLWPHIVSILLMPPAMWGIFNWVLMLAVLLFGSNMRPSGFAFTVWVVATIAVLIVVGGYLWIALHRRRNYSAHNARPLFASAAP